MESNKKVRGKRLTQEIIIDRFTKAHGNTYDYSKVVFENNNNAVIIICKRHGEYLCPPKRHAQGAKCRKCYLEDTNGKFMREPKWREWASSQMKSHKNELQNGMLKKYGVSNPSNSSKLLEIRKNTFINRYGVDNPYKLNIEDRIAKTRNTNIKNGRWLSDDDRLPFDLYKRTVWKETNKSIRIHNMKSIFSNRSRQGHHLDHIYSIYDGFINNVPHHIVGHVTNLQLLFSKKNQSKQSNSWHTLDELLNKIKNFENNNK
jgi:hypothetical protein